MTGQSSSRSKTRPTCLLFMLTASLILVASGAKAADEQNRLHPLPPAAKNAKTGPAVGAHIPAFEAVNINGKVQTFESLRGPKGLVLAFSRSADWCPFCKTQLADLSHQTEAFRGKGFGVASITYDSREVLRHFSERQSIQFTMLSDPESKAIRAFDIFNQNIEPGNIAYGIPFPGMYIINEKGIVTSKYFEEDYRERYSAASILTHEFGADGVEKKMIETPHLTLTTSASDATVAPGRHITLIVEVDPKPKMHVYAPGVQGYIPIAWQMAETKSWLVLPATYPMSKMLNLPAIHETVPVYNSHIRIVRDVVIGQEAEIAPVLGPDRTLTIEGNFRYQACDNKECYIPRTIPLTWTFRTGTLDRQRVPAELQRKTP